MPGTMSRARQTAEAAFDKTQSQFQSKTRALDEQNTEAAERAEKTRRLRAARLEREQFAK